MRLRCLVIALALLSALASDSWGQSKQPPAQSKQATQPPVPDQRGTEQVPLAVKILPATDAKQRADKEDRERQEKAKVDEKLAFETQRLADYTFRLALFTIFLFCVAVAQAGLFVWQLLLIQNSARDTKVAADAAKLNALAVINAERAHLYVIVKQHNVSDLISAAGGTRFSEAIAKDRMNPPTLAYTLKNYGKTPALVEDIAHCVSISETEGGPRTYATPERALEILGLGDETELIAVDFDERQFIAEDAKSLGDHSTMLFFYSRATFLDAFNRRHKIDSDFLYSAGRFHLISRRETSEQIQGDSDQWPERPPRVGFFGRP
jgi:hypothetical protein